MGPRPHLSFRACKSSWLAPELLVCMGPIRHLWCLNTKQRVLDKNNKSLCVTDMICRFVVQNSVISTRMTSLYGSQPSTVVFWCTTATLALELLVSIGFCHHLWIYAFKTATFETKLHVSMGPRAHLWFCACTTACLASELLVSSSPSPHLWFCAFKTATLAPEWQVYMC